MSTVGITPKEPVKAPQKAIPAEAPKTPAAYVDAPTRPYQARATRVNAKSKRKKSRAKPAAQTNRGKGVRDGAGRFLPTDAEGRPTIPRRNGKDSKPNYPDFPFLNARYYSTPEESVIIDVDFSPSFVALVDQKYANEPGWDQTLPGNAKIGLFLYYIMQEAVEPYLGEDEEVPPRSEADIMAEIPPMRIQGGPDQTQRVEISTMKKVAQLG